MNMVLAKRDRIVSEFLRSLGPWNKSVVIGGGYALLIYKLYFAEKGVGNSPVETQDLDSLLPRKVPQASTKNISQHLHEAGFKVVFKDKEIPASEAYQKVISGIDVEIEFLTDDSVRVDKDKHIRISGVVALPLSYLSMSLHSTLSFTTSSQETGWVVSPGAWMFHKGLTFPRRSKRTKFYKDLYGIWYVGTQLGSFSESAIAELKMLEKKNPSWRKTFHANLRKWLTKADDNDWRLLESQDPFGALKRIGFEHLARLLLDD